MKKIQRSVRLTAEARNNLKRTIARLTLNPALFALSLKYVDWGGNERGNNKITASDLMMKARFRYPHLPLSWAVEGLIALIASGIPSSMKPFSVQPYRKLPASIHRFSALSPSDKIRVGERWKKELAILKRIK